MVSPARAIAARIAVVGSHHPRPTHRAASMAKHRDLSEQFKTMFGLAVQLAKVSEADALLVWVEGAIDWAELRGRGRHDAGGGSR